MKATFRRRTNVVFEFNYVSILFIQKQLKSLKRNKTSGADSFPLGMLKDSLMHISQPLCHIINLSLKSGIVPSSWKIGKVVPVHKKGNMTYPANYRSISMLPVLSKILEKAVHVQMMEFLENNNLLTDRQYGYRQKSSTNMATTLLLGSIKMKVDKGLLVGADFIDLSKAFDTTSHARILDKLPSYGIAGRELSWMSSYLFSRHLFVQLDNFTSTLKNLVTTGSLKDQYWGHCYFSSSSMTLLKRYKSLKQPCMLTTQQYLCK